MIAPARPPQPQPRPAPETIIINCDAPLTDRAIELLAALLLDAVSTESEVAT